MILLLAHAALAGSCCTAGGTQPTILASCDSLGVAFGVGGDVEYGGWSWDGAWSEVGDDGGGNAVASAAIMGRFTPWLQGGLRVPVNLAMDRLDGETTSEIGLGSGLVWFDFETPAGWPSAKAPRLGLELGLGSSGPASTSPGVTVVQLGVRASGDAARWGVWGNVAGRVPVLGVGVPEGDASLVVDHTLGAKARLGLGVGFLAATGAVPSYSASLGPTLVLSPTHSDRVVLTARAGLPIAGLGQNTQSRFMISLDWYRVLSHTKE